MQQQQQSLHIALFSVADSTRAVNVFAPPIYGVSVYTQSTVLRKYPIYLQLVVFVHLFHKT